MEIVSAKIGVKETGWGSHSTKILNGLSPDMTLIILRHPCAVISSYLEGIKSGHMQEPDEAERENWLKYHRYEPYVTKHHIDRQYLQRLSIIEFFATQWRVFTDICMSIHQDNNHRTMLVQYEKLCDNPRTIMESVFGGINLDFSEDSKKFITKSTETSYNKLSIFEMDAGSDFYSVYQKGNVSAYKWKNKLTNSQVDTISRIAGSRLLNMWE